MSIGLFVPADRPERFAKAAAAGADHVILDLEDAVAPERKAFAREAVGAALRDGFRATVRINPVATADGADDLAVLAGRAPAAIMLAKCAGARDVAAVRTALPGIPQTVLIESLAGIQQMAEIAHAAGVSALAFGGYDLCAELGARPTAEVLAPWRSQIVFAARVAGIHAIDMPFAGLDDDAGLAADATRSVDFGFDGKLAIHPKQIAPIRAAFRPSPDEVARAERIVAAAAAGGVVRVDGVMIDAPLIAGARRVLARDRSE